MKTPSALAHAFVEALNLQDSPRLEALSTSTGWSARGESIGRFVKQALREDLTFVPLGELVEDNQRAALCGLLSARQSPRLHGRVWLHALKQDQWRFEGFSKFDTGSALFVSGVTPAIFTPTSLPQSERALTWGKEALLACQTGQGSPAGFAEALSYFSEDTWGELTCFAAHFIQATRRHALGLGQTRGHDEIGRKIWLALEDSNDAHFRLLGYRNGAKEALLLGSHEMTSSPAQR